MPMDLDKLIGAVTREVSERDHDGRPAKVVRAVRTYDTDLEDLWAAITTRERIERWLMPVEGELRLGGRYQLIGNAGGTVTRCEPPRHLALTWEFGGETTWVYVELSPDGDGTRLALEHVAVVGPERWDQFGPGAVGVGWDLSLLGLGIHLETGGRARPEGAVELTPELKDFTRLSSADWGRASAAGGTPEADALAAATRTTSAYLGEP